MSKLLSKSNLIACLVVSLVLIAAGAVLFGVFGFSVDSTMKDYTVIEVSDTGYMSLNDEFRAELTEFCRGEIEDAGYTIVSEKYSESTSAGGILTFEIDATTEKAGELADQLKASIDDSSIEGLDRAYVAVAGHEIVNQPAYEYIWRTAIGAAVLLVLVFICAAIRYGVGSGVTSLLAGIHDLALTLALVALFRIPSGVGLIGVAFLAMLLSALFNMLVTGNVRRDLRNEFFVAKYPDLRGAIAASVANCRKTVISIAAMVAAVIVVLGVVGVFIATDLLFFMLSALIAVAVTSYTALLFAPSFYAGIRMKWDARRAERSKYNYEQEKQREKERKQAENAPAENA